MATGSLDKAEQSFRRRQGKPPVIERSWVWHASLRASGISMMRSRRSRSDSAHSPKYVDALLFKAALLNAKQDSVKAAEACSDRDRHRTGASGASFELVSLLLRERKFDEAAEKL